MSRVPKRPLLRDSTCLRGVASVGCMTPSRLAEQSVPDATSSLIVGRQVTDVDRRWLKRFGCHSAEAEIRLLCFHHAGGSATMYRKWPELITSAIEPIAVQLPGRAERFGEPAFE